VVDYLMARPCGRDGPVGNAVSKLRSNAGSIVSVVLRTSMTWTR
jgi:hypothetical protein